MDAACLRGCRVVSYVPDMLQMDQGGWTRPSLGKPKRGEKEDENKPAFEQKPVRKVPYSYFTRTSQSERFISNQKISSPAAVDKCECGDIRGHFQKDPATDGHCFSAF